MLRYGKIQREFFAEGEDENMLKAAIEFEKNRLGTPILIGTEKRIKRTIKKNWFRRKSQD